MPAVGSAAASSTSSGLERPQRLRPVVLPEGVGESCATEEKRRSFVRDLRVAIAWVETRAAAPEDRVDLASQLLKFANSPRIYSNIEREFPCLSSNTSARNAITSSRRSCTAKRKRSARSATPKSLHHSCRFLPYRPRVHRRRPRPPGHADPAAIRAGRGHARCAT